MAKKKNIRKNVKQKKEVEEIKQTMDVKSKVFIVIGIICFFLLFYLLTIYITHKNSDSSDTPDETPNTSISYTTTIVGRSLSMSDGEYLVLFYDESNEDISKVYSGLVSSYQGELSLYSVDMSRAFNASFATEEESNKSPETAADFKINGPTLIRVNDHKVQEYIEGEEEITNYLS